MHLAASALLCTSPAAARASCLSTAHHCSALGATPRRSWMRPVTPSTHCAGTVACNTASKQENGRQVTGRSRGKIAGMISGDAAALPWFQDRHTPLTLPRAGDHYAQWKTVLPGQL